jgi:arsenate reductase
MFHLPRVLFICVHNAARSQMCEALLKQYGGDRFDARSAGLEPGELNPLAVEVMAEIGIDISQNKTKSVFDVWKAVRLLNMLSRCAMRNQLRNVQSSRG